MQKYASIEKTEGTLIYPVSAAQKRLYLLNQLEGGQSRYNQSAVVTIEGELDVAFVEQIVRTIVGRHESLRAAFSLLPTGELVAVVHNEGKVSVCFREDAVSPVDGLMEEFVQPFDLEQGPLWRVKLIKRSAREHLLLLDWHGIIADERSVMVFMEEFAWLAQGAVLAESVESALPYAKWEEEWLASEQAAVSEAYWLEQFAGELPLLDLPLDYPRPSTQLFSGDQVFLTLDAKRTAALRQMAAVNQTDVETVLLAMYKVLLAKHSSQEDVVVGTTVSARDDQQVGWIGKLEHTLALRSQPTTDKSFSAYLEEVKETVALARKHQAYPYEVLITKCNVERHVNRTPLFDAAFAYQSKAKRVLRIEELVLTVQPYQAKQSMHDVTLVVEDGGKELTLTLEYATSLFKAPRMERMLGHLAEIIKQVVSHPAIRLGEIGLMTDSEWQQVVSGFNQTQMAYPQEMTIHQLLEEQAERTPDAVALTYGGTSITYRELNERTNQIARYLRTRLGVTADTLVAVITERSVEMVTALISVLKAGGAYVPIDPAFPEERIRAIVEEAGVTTVLTTKANVSLVQHLQRQCPVITKVVQLDESAAGTAVEAASEIAGCDTTRLAPVATPESLAYVIFTSGSTGKPKGVMIEHKAVVHFIQGMCQEIPFTAGQAVLSLTTVSFDIFFLETILPLTVGMRVVIAQESVQNDPRGLCDLIRREGIDVMQTTPSRMKLILSDEQAEAALTGVAALLIGGEAFPEALLGELKQLTPARIYNVYGPTETTIWSTLRDVTEAKTIDIGRPIANTQTYIVDSHHNPLPIGVTGELCIAGAGLARGYLHQPELTAEKFVENPFTPGTKMYKTGDVARWTEDGSIEYLGRKDFQVKVRGYRIELGDIETHLLMHGAIREAVMIARKVGAQEALCAYLVADQELTVAELRRYLSQTLPDYMIPSYFIQLDSIPVTINGKVNRHALPEPDASLKTGTEYAPPTNPVEEGLVQIWQAVLQREPIGIRDNFFELGGTSLLATMLMAKVNELMEVNVPFKELFLSPTIQELSEAVAIYKAIGLMSSDPVLLMTEQREKNVFCFPPIVGFGFIFGAIAPFIESHSVYAFDFLEDEDRVEQYIQLIKKFQPEGPYVILGYSTGGILAYEIVRELERRGEVVTDLILIDPDKKNQIVYQTDEEIEQELELIYDQNNMHARDIRDAITARAKLFKRYVNTLVQNDRLQGKVHFITSIETEPDRVRAWRDTTNATYTEYSGFGAHNTMLSLATMAPNSMIVRGILEQIK
ncbi:non-ribosomal peptide synthetase [Brevibacillus dissolubilis]|uniref:non-ribosomal peptide synthetase n=1 Tax=Brevibacillus dissolubilis TaxID=1844116 RepID=UPI0011173CC6|nr:non-ribosomal peptide synthetase [Brevibacillus dissolubilis]